MNLFLAATDLANQAMAKPIEPTGTVTTGAMVLLFLAIGLALAFEFVNGFHDTANAVATVIYTNSLKPWVAVIWSGCWNLIGVLTSSGGVAFTVLALLPIDMVLHVGTSAGFAMVFSLLLSAMIWNLGTWYMGLPASSTHSLFGAIIGVGIANALMSTGHSIGDAVNWPKLYDTLLALLISPLVGFIFAGLLLLISKRIVRWPAFYQAPEKDKAPPRSVRALLISTCTLVSFGHGSNDGQKGMGLVLLILIGILPGVYALNPSMSSKDLAAMESGAVSVQASLVNNPASKEATPDNPGGTLEDYLRSTGKYDSQIIPALVAVNQQIITVADGNKSLTSLTPDQRSSLRDQLYLVSGAIVKLEADKKLTDSSLRKLLDTPKTGYRARLDLASKYIPFWVKLSTALALGLGTMVGWKRIVVTVGEKIGKTHLTYAEGASAELVAACTILAADRYHLPVSTTHVLSSGVAGTMAANHSGLQMATLRNLLMAWVLTLPVCVMLGAALFAGSLLLVLHNFLPVLGAMLAVLLLAGIFLKFKAPPTRNINRPLAAVA